MSSTTGPIPDIIEEAVRIIAAAHTESIPLRLLCGVAIYLQCSSTRSDERLQRTYKDMDFVRPMGQTSPSHRRLSADIMDSCSLEFVEPGRLVPNRLRYTPALCRQEGHPTWLCL